MSPTSPRLSIPDSASVTRMVQRLERAGFVRRRPDPAMGGPPSARPPRRRGASPPGREALGRLGGRGHWRHGAGRAPGALHGLERVEGNVAAGTDPASADQPTGRQVGRGTRVGVAMRWGPPCRNTGNCPGRGVATLTGCRSVGLATSNGANRPYAVACGVVSSTATERRMTRTARSPASTVPMRRRPALPNSNPGSGQPSRSPMTKKGEQP
ncbi:MarR family transcriptional regulator [Streptomyces sp. NPDC058690]|uniref:MarR family transcriptional regulator n=1 Tax=Streptomyces sp. NPDC058690 TaxID=3346600 RepID=UPI0036631C6F